MNVDHRIYTILCVLFSTLIVVGNLMYQKFILLPIFSLELSVAAILYPLTLLLTDLVTEFYGKEKSKFCLKLAIIMNIKVVIIITIVDNLNATNWSKVDNKIFHLVFESYKISFFASTIACYISQLVDIKIYLWIKNLTHNRFLWLRSNISTAISILVHTSVAVSILYSFNILPLDRIASVTFSNYFFKLFFTILSTPIFYLAVWIITRLKRNAKELS
ncbi:MAG: queuosine precursor transporter [Wolbachia endosymbiont of Fragariocoptes setiger]|nr:queuosine precursor transporter [Wolbachia endosymbiont of Fragariocoptes setiger]